MKKSQTGVGKKTQAAQAGSGIHLPVGVVVLLLAGWAALLAWQTIQSMGLHAGVFSLLDPRRFLPWNPALFFSHWLSVAKNYFLLFCFLSAAYALGSWLLNWLFPAVRSRLEALLFALGLGLAVLVFLIFWMGILGLYRPGWFAAVFFPLAAAGAWTAWKQREQLRPRRGWLLGRARKSDWALVAVLLGFGGLAVLAANTPELFFDSLVYHLAVPAQWLLAHRIHPLPYNFFSNLPMNMEMLYTGALLLSDERLCRLLHLAIGALTGLATFALGRRWFGRRAGWWAAGLLLSIPLLNINMLESGVDIGAAFFGILGIYVLLDWAFTRAPEAVVAGGWRREPLLAGIFIGAALGCKYNSAFMLAPAVPLLLWAAYRQGRPPRVIAAAVVGLALGGSLLVLPWMGKSLAYTGNPVYPFLFKVIPSKYIDANKMQQQMDGFREYGHRTLAQYFRQPWDMTFYYPTSNSYVGTAFLFLLPGILLLLLPGRRGPPVLPVLLATVILASLIWSNQTQISRYFIPAFPLLAVVGAWVLERWERWHPAPGLLARWALAGFLAWGGLITLSLALSNWNPVGSALGLESRTTYLDQQMLNSYSQMTRQVNALPPDAKILAVGETRTYYFERPVTAATVYDRNPLLDFLTQSASAREAWEAMRRQGYTHVFIHPSEAERNRGYEAYRWSPEVLDRFLELRARYWQLASKSGRQELYVVLPQPRMDQPVKRGRPLFTYDREIVEKVKEHANQAGAAFGQGQVADALAEEMRMRELAPEWEVPYLAIAQLYVQANHSEEAFQFYRQADALAVLDAGAYNNLGAYYMNHNQFAEAQRYFQLALAQDPQMEMARKNLSLIQTLPAARRGLRR